MTILEAKVLAGLEDDRLCEHINRLERIKAKQDNGCGISEREELTLHRLYSRLDEITLPDNAWS